jgi:hypothetical protein
MPDILIRGLAPETVARIDAQAEALGLSRNEYLRRTLETKPPIESKTPVTLADLRRASDAARDLLDPAVMDSAWR